MTCTNWTARNAKLQHLYVPLSCSSAETYTANIYPGDWLGIQKTSRHGAESQTVSTCRFPLGGSGLRLVTAARFAICEVVWAPVVVALHMLLHLFETSWEMLVCWGGLSGCLPATPWLSPAGGLVAWWVIDLSVMTLGHSYGDECVYNEHYISMVTCNYVDENLENSCLCMLKYY